MSWLNWKIVRKDEGGGVIAHEIYAKITKGMHFSEYSLKGDIEKALILHYKNELLAKFSDEITKQITPEQLVISAKEAFQQAMKEKFLKDVT